jgi:LPXTG-site transpeptidase (sortase) family protein
MKKISSGWVKFSKIFTRIVIFILVGLLFTGVMILPRLASSAQLSQIYDPFLPIILNNSYFGPTETITPSPTPTVTGTVPTPTNTATIGPSPTYTLTPSATPTGTLLPNGAITISVTGSPANLNQNLVFTIKVTNIGTGPTYNNIVADSFATYLDVLTVTTTQGSVSKSTHSFTVSIGNINPGAVVTIVATVRVNSSLARNETTTNTASLTYTDALGNTVLKTAGVSYQVIYQTLPPTGELPLNWRESVVNPLTLIPGILMIALGAALLVMIIVWPKARENKYRLWMTVGGALLVLVGFVMAVTATGVLRPSQSAQILLTPTQPGDIAGEPGQLTPTTLARLPASAFSTPDNFAPLETLPDYPVPSPVITVTPQPGEAGPDTSEVTRIVIPILMLDTVVKYVPFDGASWMIAGLRQEVAWMGDTSWPGLGSNTGLAGHVTVAGMGDGPFRHLDELPVGELVLLYTENNIYTYQVRESKITDDGDMSVIQPTDNSQISLITCVDWDQENHTYQNRLVVIADLIRTDPITIGRAP